MISNISYLAFFSIFVSIFVLGLKLIAWWITGSVALYSDALESIVNIITSCLTFWAILITQKPPDTNHPYGHHKVEYFSAIMQGLFICFAAFLIAFKVWSSHKTSSFPENSIQGLIFLVFGIVINGIWMTIISRKGAAKKSPALIAEGKHILADIITSLGLFLGFFFMMLTGWSWVDQALALMVALSILWQGCLVIVSSFGGLMDKAANSFDLACIHRIISQNLEGALEIHDLKTRIAGQALFIEFHLVVDDNLTVRNSHALCDRLEQAIQAEIPKAYITIHVEPESECRFLFSKSSKPIKL